MLQLRTLYQETDGYKNGYKLTFQITTQELKFILIVAKAPNDSYTDFATLPYPASEKQVRDMLNSFMDTYISELDKLKNKES